MSLKDEVYLSGSWQNNNSRFANTTGTAIDSIAESGSGELIADDYTLTVSSVAGGTGTVTVSTAAPNNPYNGRVVTGVPLNGSTAVTNVVPGLAIVFKNTTANGNVSHALGGNNLGVFDAFGVAAGVPSTGLRHRVTNNGSSVVSDTKAILLPQSIVVKKTGTVFKYVRPFADGAIEKTAGGGSDQTMPYALKVINVAGSGAAKTADLQVDGVTLGAASVLNLQTGAEVSGTGLKAISPAYGYRIISGPLTGLEFALSDACASNDIGNVLIFPSRFIQIAPDVSGAAGTYGTADVPLTQSGQGTGVIQPAGVAYYWVRVLVPLNAVAESNPHPGNIVLQASETSAAGWTA